MRRALYIGRFQIFHNGHLGVIRHIDSQEDIDEIIIGIGSSQYSNLLKSPVESWSRNPFTYEERKEMLERSLHGVVSKPYSIFPVPDLHNYPKWVDRLKEILPEFHRIYTPDPTEQEYFREKGYEASDIPVTGDCRATVLRDMLMNGEDLARYAPAGTLAVLERIGGMERVKTAYEKDLLEILNS